jgi:hypothetical protein
MWKMIRMLFVAHAGSLFGTALVLWLAEQRPQRGLLTGDWLKS